MVKSRIIKWNLHKKLQHSEVHTALRILGPDAAKWPCPNPQFHVRGRIVDYQDLVRYLRRKGVDDPTKWATSRPDPHGDSSEVRLLVDPPTVQQLSSSAIAHASASQRDGFRNQGLGDELDTGQTIEAEDYWPSALPQPSSLSREFEEIALMWSPNRARPPDPPVFVLAASLVWKARAYCLEYVFSARANNHAEPIYHQKTSHGHFADRMKHGLSLFARKDYDDAFDAFESGFDLLPEIVANDHPMALTLILAVLCQLITSGAGAIAASLLTHMQKLLHSCYPAKFLLIDLISQLQDATQVLEFFLLGLRSIMDTVALDISNTDRWKAFYVRERYCDALYHAQVHGEGSMLRARLLAEQEAHYGTQARNVLWTAATVADNSLIYGRLDAAEHQYRRVLQGANTLCGFDRAQIRFAALEGLADTLQGRVPVSKVEPRARDTSATSPSGHMQEAVDCLSQALKLGTTWFNPRCRRVDRVKVKLLGVTAQFPAHDGNTKEW